MILLTMAREIKCDGWLRAGSNDAYSIGYYQQNDLAFMGQAAPQWTAFSRYFAAIMSANRADTQC